MMEGTNMKWKTRRRRRKKKRNRRQAIALKEKAVIFSANKFADLFKY